jgi:hypothetical protein
MRPVSDIHAGSEMAFSMLEAYNQSTDIQMRLSKIATERSQWVKYDAKMCLFPQLDEHDLRKLCFGRKTSFSIRMSTAFFVGSYQVKQAVSYIKDHLTPSILNDDEVEFIVELSSKYDNLVRARFSSRHFNSKMYTSIIQYQTTYTDHPIDGWYCTCVVGWRDVGCCVHVTALLWHLGVNRAEINQNIHPLSATKLFESINDSAQFSDATESDDDGDD